MIRAEEIAFATTRQFRRIGEAHYRLTDELHGVELDADRLWRDRHELWGELSVYCGIKGAKTIEGCLSRGNFNFSSTQARERHAGLLRGRAKTADALDWHGLLEEFCIRIGNAEREGQPIRRLREYDRPTVQAVYDVAGLTILKRHPQMFFGDGGSFKSYLGLYLGGLLVEQGVRVLYADWELSGEDHRDRLERLFGSEMPDGLWYHRCQRPMIAEADSIRRRIDDLGIEFVICDSVAFATSGPPEASDAAIDYFRAVRQFGEYVGTLHIAHVVKPKEDDTKTQNLRPFGSTFWHNSARATWFVKRAADTADASKITIGVYNQKANIGPLRPAVGLQIDFDADRTHVHRIDLADVADLAAGLPLWRRISAALKHGPQTITSLVDELGARQDSIEKSLKRGKDRIFTRITDAPDGVHRWGLIERMVA